MPSMDEATASIVERFNAAWPTIEPDIPFATLNSGFQRDPSGASWVLLRPEMSGGEQITLGSPGANRVRRHGMLWLDAFVPIGSGTDDAFKLASEAAQIFECQDFDGVVFYAMEPGGGASNTDDGLYFGESVSLAFAFDEDR